jgi:hypothetical protein
LPFMERLLGFCGESAEDDVLDGFMANELRGLFQLRIGRQLTDFL